MPTCRFERYHRRLLSDHIDVHHCRFSLDYAQIVPGSGTEAFNEVKRVKEKENHRGQGSHIAWSESVAYCIVPEGPYGDNKARESDHV